MMDSRDDADARKWRPRASALKNFAISMTAVFAKDKPKIVSRKIIAFSGISLSTSLSGVHLTSTESRLTAHATVKTPGTRKTALIENLGHPLVPIRQMHHDVEVRPRML
mmetsp:Transcript_123548/g.283318  ORF Transcript_123548/g.283318 Transcript_123548/m.283318 type:complete len:109 (-) Transcript_123548:1861-2187(-)